MPTRTRPHRAGMRRYEMAQAPPGCPAATTGRSDLDPRGALMREPGLAVFDKPGRGTSAILNPLYFGAIRCESRGR
jgi:hypothetical protein